MALEERVRRRQNLFAARATSATTSAQIMAIANRTDIVSFCGGIPARTTFPGEAVAELLIGIVEAGDPTVLQYAPT